MSYTFALYIQCCGAGAKLFGCMEPPQNYEKLFELSQVKSACLRTEPLSKLKKNWENYTLLCYIQCCGAGAELFGFLEPAEDYESLFELSQIKVAFLRTEPIG